MPLGLFGGGTSSNKPQVLGNDGTSKKDSSKTLNESNCKGVSLKLTNTSVTIEKQLAEGGFAIVYLVTDKKNRKFALKRQFVLDNQKQLDACIRECKIVSDLRGHKNIVEYVDHMITMNKYGQYDCMLLTVYHKRNVLQLMNERISNNLHLSATEILNIFCDMCEAVARLHHSNTPVIHRDLKVENILIDERNRAAPPTFVLCDFGSATTKVMSINTQPAATIQDEIERNTTLCYRAPEMVDIYGGQPIGVPADMWSMGVMLYRLCYFALPFEESALAIQNGNYTPFPAHPDYPAAIRAIIYLLLDVDVSRRLPIFECSSLAFEAYGKPLPIENVYGVKIPSLEQAIMDLKEGKPRNHTVTPKVFKEPREEKKKVEEVLISTNEPVIAQSTTTSVNPRLRPKATSNILAGISANIPPSKGDEIFKKDNRQSFPGELEPTKMETTAGSGPLSCPLVQPADLGFTDLVVDDPAIPRDRAATDSTGQRPPLNSTSQVEASSKPTTSNTQQHRRNVSDTTQISKSAFKPYSQTAPVSSNVRSVEDMRKSTPKTENVGEWNPFLAAPFSNSPFDEKDDFGQAFDVLPRRETTVVPDDDTSSIDSRDPFGAAPFDQLTGSQTSSSISSFKQTAHENEEKEAEQIENMDMVDGRNGGAGEEEPGNTVQAETDSEVDEQRMYARRRYSYENIDGVGDDASSDSRGRTDRDDSEDDYYDDDEDRVATTAATSATKRRGDADTSHDDDDDDEDEDDTSSQNTVGSEDGGNRPLLEDDGLEDDDENEFFDNRLNAPLFIGTNNCTNPFLRDELTPKMLSPNNVVEPPPQKEPVKLRAQTHTDDEWDLGDRWSDRRDTIHHRPTLESSATLTLFAPATLPRQQTPLAAWKPELPATAPVSIIPSMSTTSFPDTTNNVGEDATDSTQPCEPVVGTLISVGAPTEMPPPKPIISATKTDALIYKNPVAAKIDFVEGPKTPKPTTKKKIRASVEPPEEENDSDLETDGSEAEIFASESSTQAVVKKKKKGFGLRSSHPSIGTGEFSTPVMKKSSKERKISSSAQKRASTGALNNASFVNTSFQYEDMDSPVQRF